MSEDPTTTAAEDWVHALAALANPPLNGLVNAGQRRYKYALLPDLLDEVRAKLGAHGWAVTQEFTVTDGTLALWTTFVHTSGVERSYGPVEMPVRGGPQDLGSLLTYLRRYTLSTYLGVQGDEDEDGQHAQRAAQTPSRAPQADREAYGQTHPVQRAQGRPDDPVNRVFAPPAGSAGGAGEVQGSPPRRPPTLSTHQQTEHPYDGHQAHQHGASDKSIKMMWALLRKTGMTDEETRQWVAAYLGIDTDWHTNTLTQKQVSDLIDELKTEQLKTEQADE